jgi:hypothetical protein
VYLHTQKDLNLLLAGYLEVLLDYQFDVVHWPGICNVLPDHLSWLFPASLWEESVVSTDTKNVIQAATKYDFQKKQAKAKAPVVRLKDIESGVDDDTLDLDSTLPFIAISDRTMVTIISPEEQKEIVQ